MTTTEKARNLAAFTRFHEATGSGSFEVVATMIDEVVEPDVVFHAPVPMDATGAEALKQVWTVLLRAFPDLRVEAEDVLADGDKVVCRNIVTGTHRGEFRGLPATGKTVSYGEIFIFRFAGGRIAEIWGVVDVLTQLRQLGALTG
ncbi:ester cyclase [Amycolatopsis alba]|uniref:Ester cyclase n=1 Tax=Amycolatopsis alba DSM 44262 TaxID=1125972 RepID=A0A229S9Z9_AMYAL|nr:ester cyclase [Amycolatopsis alba]OXM55762.1 ester cyclase [Amycolatopsis alba DSM 44262]